MENKQNFMCIPLLSESRELLSNGYFDHYYNPPHNGGKGEVFLLIVCVYIVSIYPSIHTK